MSHATLEKQIRSLPDECLDEVAHYIEFILFRHNTKAETEQTNDLTEFFGSMKNLADGMEFQRRVRDEWN